jgi:hypothetical protein
MKSGRQYALGQKIPSSIKTFGKQEIAGKQFSARHSSMLRILTKWAEYLEEIFKIPEQYVKRRLYPFRNIYNQLVNLGKDEKLGEGKLIRRLSEEYVAVKEKFKKILRTSYGAMANFLGAENSSSFVSSVSRYTETRTVSSKINAVLTSLMLDYTNTLIHHLLKAGQKISTDKGYQNLNLVSFRVSDLLRSKLQCSESSFISLLNTMYLLDNSEYMRGLFKLVRIKNKLDDPASNIMINYLFMGKIQCELQLSIQEAKGKEKHYYTMSHFVYELVRGKFGSIAECAIMVSQLDPMIAACKQPYYQEKEAPFNLVLAGED